MFDSLSPELVLVLPPQQRAAAIRELPMFEPWRPTRPTRAAIAVSPPVAMPTLLATAALYFVAKLFVTLGAAAAVIVAIVAFAVVASLLI